MVPQGFNKFYLLVSCVMGMDQLHEQVSVSGRRRQSSLEGKCGADSDSSHEERLDAKNDALGEIGILICSKNNSDSDLLQSFNV